MSLRWNKLLHYVRLLFRNVLIWAPLSLENFLKSRRQNLYFAFCCYIFAVIRWISARYPASDGIWVLPADCSFSLLDIICTTIIFIIDRAVGRCQRPIFWFLNKLSFLSRPFHSFNHNLFETYHQKLINHFDFFY